MPIKQSELILNPDGSVYHLNLLPQHLADTVITVGDQDRVEAITKHFDSVEFTTQKREFKTQTGTYKGKRLTVISTGIGPDNIDIVFNELDALANIDLATRQPKKSLKSLKFIRIGTSGAIQPETPVDSFLISTHGLELHGMLRSYQCEVFDDSNFVDAFIAQTNWSQHKARPLLIMGSRPLYNRFKSESTHEGVTATAGGFYGPQGRVLRLPLQDADLNKKMDAFEHDGLRISNFEMETSAIYGMSKLLGHEAISLNAIIANRALGTFSENPQKTIDSLILYTLDRIIQ